MYRFLKCFFSGIDLLKDLVVNRVLCSNDDFSYMESYTFVFFLNYTFYNISINENRTMRFKVTPM